MSCGPRSGWGWPATPSAARAPSSAPRPGGTPGTMPPGALRLAETVADLGSMRATVHGRSRRFRAESGRPRALAGLGFAIRMNNLKVTAARMAPEIVAGALAVCGVSGYRCDSPYAVGRHLRDAHSAALMISNDRILAANAVDAPRCTRKTEVATDRSDGAERPTRVPGSAAAPRPPDLDRCARRLRPQR